MRQLPRRTRGLGPSALPGAVGAGHTRSNDAAQGGRQHSGRAAPGRYGAGASRPRAHDRSPRGHAARPAPVAAGFMTSSVTAPMAPARALAIAQEFDLRALQPDF